MSLIQPATSQIAFNKATIDALGGLQLASGGGCLSGPGTVAAAGSSDCAATLYDGTDTTGKVIATFSLGDVGSVMLPNFAFAKGLFVNVTGTTPGTLQLIFNGNAA